MFKPSLARELADEVRVILRTRGLATAAGHIDLPATVVCCSLFLVDPRGEDATIGREAHRVAEEPGAGELEEVDDVVKRRQVAFDVVEVVECPRNFLGPC